MKDFTQLTIADFQICNSYFIQLYYTVILYRVFQVLMTKLCQYVLDKN